MDSATSVKNNAGQAQPKKGGSGRNSEKRRERSKVAARCRRSKESEIFSELAEYLPLPESTRNSLDKASVMRLSLSDLKLRHMMERVFAESGLEGRRNDGLDELEAEIVSMVNNAMGGFLLVMSTEGDIIYASDSIATHLGLSQVEVMGLSIYDFSHPCDHGDIKEMLAVNKKDGKEQDEIASRSSTFRMKCTITARGRNVHLRAASYKVIDFTGRMFSGIEKDSEANWFIGIGEPLFHPSDVDIPLNKQTFLTKHTPDMKCEFVDDSIMCFLGYQPDDLIGKSIFEFHHAADGPALAKAFKSLYTKGQSVTERYRFLAKHGGWVWVITQATLIQPNNGSKPNSIVCLNFVTSGIENEEEIMSSVQEERSVFSPFKMVLPEVKNMGLPEVSNKCETLMKRTCENEIILPEIIPESKPIMSTKTVIAPRTEDMDSGFLMPCDDTLIVSKEEPEDLTHLAPIAGDACVPLDMPIPLLDTLLKEMEQANVPFIFNDNCVEVNFDEVPNLTLPVLSTSPTGPEPENDGIDVCGKQSPCLPVSAPSPLFLNSDPPMVSSPGSKSSLLSPFQLSPNPTPARTCRSNSDCSTASGSTYEFEPSPKSGSGYEDSRSPPALIGLSLQEDAFQAALLMENHLDDPGPAVACNNMNGSKPSDFNLQRSSDQGNYQGAFITLPDGRKFPVLMSNSNEILWSGQPFLNRDCTGDAAKRGVSPVQETKFSNFSNQNSLIDFMKMESKPVVTVNPAVISTPSHDAFDAVLKGGGGSQVWDWTASAAPVRKLSQMPVTGELQGHLGATDTSSGPPLAKHPRISPSCNGGAGSSLPMEYEICSEIPRKQAGQSIMTLDPTLTPANRKIPSQNRNSPAVTTIKVQQNPGTVASSESAIADLGIDLRSCLQKLLSSGRADKVNEILRLLKETNNGGEDAERATDPGSGKGIGDAGGGHPFGIFRQVQNSGPPSGGQSAKLFFTNSRQSNNHGSLLTTLGTSSTVGPSNLALPGLFELTRQDCEVNAPLNESSCLLNGADLLNALENDGMEDPFE